MPADAVRQEEGDAGELFDGIYQEFNSVLSDRAERPFLPWHKPRKHYIRIYQWCSEVRHLIKINSYRAGDRIRYLGFPGEDFLDVRTLQGVCQPQNIWVKYLGFDSTSTRAGSDFQFNLSLHEVYDLGFVDEHSRVLKTRIETLVKENSLARQWVANYRDFDIINIDLCNSLAVSTEEEYPPYFEAIKILCDLQIAGRTRPWLLFLATRAIREQFDARTKFKLFDCVLKNIQESPQFAASLQSTFALDDKAILDELSNTHPLAHSDLVNLFGISIGKWLLRMLWSAVPKVKVTLLKSYSYRVAIDEPDMLSLAFRFEPILVPTVDRSGLTKSAGPRAAATEEWQLGVSLISAVSGIVDIDEKLVADTDLHAKMIKKCGDLLQSVHYDKNRYRQWAEAESWKPASPNPTPPAPGTSVD